MKLPPGGEGGQAAGRAGGEGGQGGGREADEHAGGEGRREGEAAKARREQQLTVGKGDDGCVELHYIKYYSIYMRISTTVWLF